MTLTARELAFLLVLVFSAGPPAGAQEESGAAREARDRDRREEERRLQQRQFDAHRFGAGGSDPFAVNPAAVHIRRLNAFRSDIERFARQVVGLGALRYAPMSEAWAEADLRERSGSLTETIDALLAFVAPGRPVPESGGASRPREGHAARIEELIRSSRRLIPRMVELTTGEVLDWNLQKAVSNDLAALRGLTSGLSH